MPTTRRQERVAERIHHEISSLLLLETKDPRVASVTVTDVQVSPDLKLAKVFYSALGDDEVRRQAAEGLEHARPFLRREVAHRLQLRFATDLAFLPDESWKSGSRVDELLEQLHRESAAGAAPQDDASSDNAQEE